MANFIVNFKNDTDSVWTMSVYQLLPAGAGLDSVSWQQITAPPSGYGSPPVSWDISYNVVLGLPSEREGADYYQLSQVLQCDPGTSWDIVYKDNVKQLIESGTAQPNHIVINNKSGLIACPGIGMSGYGAVYKNNVLSGMNTRFIAAPSYWVGLFQELLPGDVISDNVIAGPLELNFPANISEALLTVHIEGETLILDLSYLQSKVLRLEE
jgi:hypothetical protein